jgi:hypothetical protein
MATMQHEPPPISDALIRWLEQVFPDTIPVDTSVTLDRLRFQQGQVSVLRKIRMTYEDQNNYPDNEED